MGLVLLVSHLIFYQSSILYSADVLQIFNVLLVVSFALLILGGFFYLVVDFMVKAPQLLKQFLNRYYDILASKINYLL